MTWAAALAAVVSILAAIAAAREARSVTTLNHKIAALDRQAEQMREDYRNLLRAIGDTDGTMLSRFASVYVAGEVLRAHPRANGPLSTAIDQLTDVFAGAVTDPGKRDIGALVEGIRNGFREAMADVERTRSDLL